MRLSTSRSYSPSQLELHEAAAVPARLAFGNERRCFTAERIDVDVVTAATKAARTGERIALGMNSDSAVRLDDLALNAIALPAMASTAHGRPRISASASLARVKFTMSENEPSERFSRYMPEKRTSGTVPTYAEGPTVLSSADPLRKRTRAILAAIEDR